MIISLALKTGEHTLLPTVMCVSFLRAAGQEFLGFPKNTYCFSVFLKHMV